MKVLLFGATGMVGQGVLRECLLDSDVHAVGTIGRTATGRRHQKLREIELRDLSHLEPIAGELSGFDACFFCLGVSSAGMSAKDYLQITCGITLAVAKVLCGLNPGMTFIYVSGAGTDSSEKSRTMWARVKGRTENALLRLPFHATYMFRPGLIVPMHGIKSKTAAYRILYTLAGPILPLLLRMSPNQVLTTEDIGRAMLIAAKQGAPKTILESRDIRALLYGLNCAR